VAQSTPSLQRLKFLRAAIDRGLLNVDLIFGPRPQDAPTLSEGDWLMRFEVLRAKGTFEEGDLADLLREFHLDHTPAFAVDDLSAFPERLKDRFEPIAKLGEGGMGVVFKAYDRRLERTVALKFLKHLEAQTWERFLREARSQAQLDHPAVGRVFEVVHDEERPHLVLQYIDGPTLTQAAERLSLREIVVLMREVAGALDACHRAGILHRDLKPGNILLERKGDGPWRPYLVDFGLARQMDSDEATLPGIMLGTPAFSSPEVLRGEEADPRSDVYGLGTTLFAVLTGHPPFEASSTWELLRRVQEEDPPSPRSLRSDIPPDLETVLLKCLEKDPARRYPTARALGEDLQRYLEGDPIQAFPPTWRYRALKRIRKHAPRIAAWTAGSMALALLGIALWNWRQSRLQAQLAQTTTQAVDRMELELSRELGLPAHDVRPSLERIRTDLDRLRERLQGRTPWVQAPARVALGRGYASLGRWEEARVELQRAWDEGRLRDSDTASLLGTTLAHLYQQALEGLRGKAREDRRRELELELRQPALAFLSQASDAASPHIRALLASVSDRPEEARGYLKTLQAQQSWNPEGWLLQAELDRAVAGAATARGEFATARSLAGQALEALLKAETLQRSNPRILLAQAQTHQLLLGLAIEQNATPVEAFDQARAASDRALAVDAGNARTWSARSALFRTWATHLLRQGQDPTVPLQAAAEAAEAGLKLRPEDNDLWNNFATLLRTRANWEAERGIDPSPTLARAVEALRGALVRPQIKDFLLNNLGNCLASQADWALHHGGDPLPLVEEASRCFKEAMSLRPWVGHPASEGGALKVAAQYQHWVGGDPVPWLNRALAAYEEALALNPNSYLTLQWMAEAHLRRAEWAPTGATADLTAARNQLERALALNPKSREAAAHRVDLAILQRDWTAADRWLRELGPIQETLPLRARLFLARGTDPSGLIPRFVDARKAAPWDSDLALWHGRILTRLAKPGPAAEAFQSAIRLNSNLAREVRQP
jgi:tetratricopeptide (TPR) repeat protein